MVSTEYPWHLLRRTILLLLGFLAMGLSDAVRGPTLLDLKDLVNADIGEISFIFLLFSIGSLIGCLVAGFILDFLPKHRYLILCLTLCTIGLSSILLPRCPSISLMYVVSFFAGLGSGALDTGCNVLILDIWTGGDSGPYMHSLHFVFGVGAFLAPVLAKPFLLNVSSFDVHGSLEDEPSFHNTTSRNSTIQAEKSESVWTIKTLYSIIGSYSFLVSFGFLFYYILDLKSKTNDKDNTTDQNEENKTRKDNNKCKKIILTCIISTFFFFYVGMEITYGTFVSTFGVESALGLSRQQGSDITAIFWGSFAVMRGVAIVAAIWVAPSIIMAASFLCCMVGSICLAIWGQSALIALQVGTGALGVGAASIYATGLLWFEQRVAVTNKIGALFVFTASAGCDVFPILVGQFIGKHPMVFMYVQVGVLMACILMFILAALVGRGMQSQNITKTIEMEERNANKDNNSHINPAF